ncbi:ComEA family DNA-binding protein [Paenibacillus sp. strain BS8-2]
MRGWVENRRSVLVLACLLGAAIFLGTALFAQPSPNDGQWVPLNDAMETLLAERDAQAENGKSGHDERAVLVEERKDEADRIGMDKGDEALKADLPRNVDTDAPSAIETKDTAESSEKSGGGIIDINRASAEELDQLKGIGPSKAQAIVADREQLGKFRSVDDLLRVKGIGEKLLASIKESVVALP